MRGTEEDRRKLFNELWEEGPQINFEMIEAGVAAFDASLEKPTKEAICDIFTAMWAAKFPEWKRKNSAWASTVQHA